MTLLAAAQIDQAAECDLVDLLGAITRRLVVIDENRLIAVAKEALTKHGLHCVVRITVGVDEWDDGYFYSGILQVEDCSGEMTWLTGEDVHTLGVALDEPLTRLSYDGSRLGRQDRLEIDLLRGVVRR